MATDGSNSCKMSRPIPMKQKMKRSLSSKVARGRAEDAKYSHRRTYKSSELYPQLSLLVLTLEDHQCSLALIGIERQVSSRTTITCDKSIPENNPMGLAPLAKLILPLDRGRGYSGVARFSDAPENSHCRL
jgi:hypothetical protein